MDNRFQQMDTGRFFSGTIYTLPGASRPLSHTAKGLCIRLGNDASAAICYDTELLRVSAGWTGAFLELDPARYGLIVPPKIAGEIQFTSPVIPGWASSSQGREAGFIDSRPDKPFGPLPRDHAHYRGMYLHGQRVVLAYTVGTTEVLESPWTETVDGLSLITRTLEIAPSDAPLRLVACGSDGVARIATVGWVDARAPSNGPSSPSRHVALDTLPDGLQVVTIQPRRGVLRLQIALAARPRVTESKMADLVARLPSPAALQPLTQSGPARWTANIMTRMESVREAGLPFAVDTLPLPFENPYRALFFVGGHDFFANGDAALCTAHGDVWRVAGLDDPQGRLSWKRFATGLFQPLGIKVLHDQVFVVGRDQITRLHDGNGDGEADYYENFNNEGHVTTNGHEYVTCLETDRHGNFYFLKGDSGGKTQHDGSVLQVTPDGKQLTVFATGFRNANGMGIGPRDEITVAPQEGEWTPASGIFPVTKGTFGGAMQVHHRAQPPTDFQRPICWLPRRVDNSSGGQVWVPPGRWGELGGRLLHLSYGQCTIMAVLRETVSSDTGDMVQQGGAVVLPLQFQSGVMRGRFHPLDGHLYLSGLHGWVSNAVQDGCFQRVRYVGGPLVMPVVMKSYANGIALTFSEPLDKATAEDADNYQAEQWNYRWSAQYGSPELRPSQPNVEGRDTVVIESASLLADGRTLFLEIPHLRPVSQLQLHLLAKNKNTLGVSRRQTLHATVHHVPTAPMDVSHLARAHGRGYLSEKDRDRLVSGLIFRFEQGSSGKVRRDTSRRRTPVLEVPANSAATPWLQPGPLRAVVEGYLRIPIPGDYSVSARGNGRAKVFLNDVLVNELPTRTTQAADPSSSRSQPVASPRPARQLSGYVRLRVEYEQPVPEEGVSFSLAWATPGGVEELLSPAALFSFGDDANSLAGDELRHGHALLRQYRCGNCHVIPGQSDPVDGPSLDGVGDRLDRAWLTQWLLSPHTMRNEVTMPSLLGDPASPVARQRAADLTAFLSTLGTATNREFPSVAAPKDEALRGGRAMFEDLGCIGCHRFTVPAQSDEFQRISLYWTSAKFQSGALARFLRQPHAHEPTSRMPDFHLSETEAAMLSAYLTQASSKARAGSGHDATRAVGATFPQGDPTNGQRLVQELRCVACHDFGQTVSREAVRSHRLPWRPEQSAVGCLAGDSYAAPIAPRFDWTAGEHSTLRAAWQASKSLAREDDLAEGAEQLFKKLRCEVCHGRDDRSSVLPAVLAEESGSGLLSESLPNLTWTGERLHAAWMERFIKGQVPDRPRPHLRIRMPTFPAYSRSLAVGMAAQHGITEEGSSVVTVSEAGSDLAVGYRLTSRDGGLDCRQCHGVGTQPPQGDAKTLLAHGINFAHVRQRLRYDFYRRFVLDPPRYDISTRMPKLSADGRTTSVQHIYNGDAGKQFDAIWWYLQTIDAAEP